MAFRTLANKTVAVSGTAERLTASDLVVASIIVTAEKSNTGDIYLAEVGEADAANEVGILLEPGKSVSINPGGISGKDRRQDINEIEIDATVNTDGVSISYLEK